MHHAKKTGVKLISDNSRFPSFFFFFPSFFLTLALEVLVHAVTASRTWQTRAPRSSQGHRPEPRARSTLFLRRRRARARRQPAQPPRRLHSPPCRRHGQCPSRRTRRIRSRRPRATRRRLALRARRRSSGSGRAVVLLPVCGSFAVLVVFLFSASRGTCFFVCFFFVNGYHRHDRS